MSNYKCFKCKYIMDSTSKPRECAVFNSYSGCPMFKEASKFNKLTDYHIGKLTDDWCFMSLINFFNHVEEGYLIDDDGYGEFIYIDKNGTMYLKEDDHIYPSDIQDLISEIGITYCYEAVKIIREKYNEEDYKVFAVFWYNR
mgnify:CR=1 FL=1